jgi:hypothetical protein
MGKKQPDFPAKKAKIEAKWPKNGRFFECAR